MRLYVIFDRVAEEAGPIFEAKNDAVAQRQLRALFVQDRVSRPDEYWLFCVGAQDKRTMELEVFSPAERVDVALKVVADA